MPCLAAVPRERTISESRGFQGSTLTPQPHDRKGYGPITPLNLLGFDVIHRNSA